MTFQCLSWLCKLNDINNRSLSPGAHTKTGHVNLRLFFSHIIQNLQELQNTRIVDLRIIKLECAMSFLWLQMGACWDTAEAMCLKHHLDKTRQFPCGTDNNTSLAPFGWGFTCGTAIFFHLEHVWFCEVTYHLVLLRAIAQIDNLNTGKLGRRTRQNCCRRIGGASRRNPCCHALHHSENICCALHPRLLNSTGP